jgi:outer membrane receptor protein involved in Fe transport
MYSLRSSTAWHIGDRTSATLVINYFDEDSDRLRGAGAYCEKDEGVLGCLPNRGKPNGVFHSGGSVGGILTGLVGAVTQMPFPDDDMANSINPAGARTVNMDFDPAYETDETIISLEIEHDFGDYSLVSVSGYQESDYDARVDFDYSVASEPWPFPVTFDRGPDGTVTTDRLLQNDRATTEPEQWSQELRLTSDFGGDWNFMLGGYWLDYEADNHFTVYSSSLALYGQTFNLPESTHVFDNEARDVVLETWALFGELYYDINDKTELTLGIRYTDEKKETDQRTIYLDFLADPNAPGGDYLALEDDWQETTGKLNLNYHWSDDIMLYATAARSYKSGGFNPIDPNSPLLDPDQGGDPGLAGFDPEFINSIEVGAKTRFFNSSLQANLTYFYYDYEDLQVSKFVSQTSVNENMDADLQGFEAELIWVPDEHWTLSMNLSWLDTELGNFETFDPADPNQMGTAEGIISAGNENIYLACLCPGIEIDVDGNELPNAPEYSAYIDARYRWYLANGMEFEVATNYYYQDEYYTRIFNTQDDELDSWDTWNASMVLSAADQRWYAEGWVRNIGDEDHVTGQQLQDPGAGLYRTFYLLEPRTYGVTLGYNF